MDEPAVNVIRDAPELLFFELFATEGFDDADAIKVLLDGGVEVIVSVENADEGRMDE